MQDATYDATEKPNHNISIAITVENPLSLGVTLKNSPAFQEWGPVIITKCQFGMAKFSAPCLAESNVSDNLIMGQELVYPAFKLHVPSFANEEHKSFWIEHVAHLDRMRVSEDRSWAEYPAFYGQNLVFSNAMYTGDPPADNWKEESCMGTSSSHLSFFKKADSPPTVKNLIIATVPDSWSMQHFLDRTTVVWSQAQIAIPEATMAETAIISGSPPRDDIVNEIYAKMVSQHLHSLFHVAAERLIFSCRAPLIHPFTMLRITEEISKDSPTDSKRKTILYCSRSAGGTTRNGGRRVLNEDKVLNALKKVLQEREQSEELVMFRHSDFATLSDLVKFFRTRVKAVVGPHGSAFHNARFALPQTLLLEIIPKSSFFQPCFWEQARLHSQDYAAFVASPDGLQNDMTVDNIPAFTNLFRERLEYLDRYEGGDALKRHYPWRVPQ